MEGRHIAQAFEELYYGKSHKTGCYGKSQNWLEIITEPELRVNVA